MKAWVPRSTSALALVLMGISLFSLACATTQVSEPAAPAEAASAEAKAEAKAMKDDAKAEAKAMKDDAKAEAKAMKEDVMAQAGDEKAEGEELVNPPELRASSNQLEVDLRIQMTTSTNNSNFAGNDYRWYGYNSTATGVACPATYEQDGDFCYGPPAPTLRLRRQSLEYPPGVGYPGDALTVNLTNALAPPVPASSAHDCNYEGVDESPNCFHGDNITNFHFHGFHVSPNPNNDQAETYSDYVLVEIYPENTGLGSCVYPDCREGSATFKLAALNQYQPEGSHWYHPHKHAATALQVSNGMAGAMIVEGPYDDWLAAEICTDAPESCERPDGTACMTGNTDCRVTEKLLILQQIFPEMGFPVKTDGQPGDIFTNGQLNPEITIQPGEIQRWRYFNAGVTSGANYAVEFSPETFYGKCDEDWVDESDDAWCIKQIAMDGVPFAQENYEAQPLLYKENSGGTGGGQCLPVNGSNSNEDGNLCFLLAAGNRADFLVQAALDATAGTHQIGVDLQGEVLGFFSEKMQNRVRRELETEHKRLARLQPALELELSKVELPIFRTTIEGPAIQAARLPEAGDDYPYNAAGDSTSPYASPANLVETITSPEVRADPIVFKMTGYTGGTLPGSWNPDGDEYFGDSINQAVNCCRKWVKCESDDQRNCCVGDAADFGCYDVSPPPNGENVPCGELIGQFWIDDMQYDDSTNYSADLHSKWQYEWANAVAPPIIDSGSLASCPPIDGSTTFTVQLRTSKNPDVIEQFQVVSQLDASGENGCTAAAGNHCISGQLKRGTGEWADQAPAELTAQTNAVQHPIHIHVNPFQVERPDHPGVAVFQDTIGLPVAEDGSFTVKQEYRSYDGTFVFHCHILGHEDRGMMQKFEVTSP